MEFRNLQTFLCVADLLSFSKAALRLGYSQSNVSFQIRQLEDELGVRLFERTGKPSSSPIQAGNFCSTPMRSGSSAARLWTQ